MVWPQLLLVNKIHDGLFFLQKLANVLQDFLTGWCLAQKNLAFLRFLARIGGVPSGRLILGGFPSVRRASVTLRRKSKLGIFLSVAL